MGNVKDQMQPTKASKDGGKTGLLGKLSGWQGKKSSGTTVAAHSFADHVSDAHTLLSNLRATKRGELTAEKGREEYNQQALARLETMNYHLESIMDLVVEYSQS